MAKFFVAYTQTVMRNNTIKETKITSIFFLFVTSILIVTLFMAPKTILLLDGCTMQSTFGIPCPLCGTTRCVTAITHFHILNALIEHTPLVILLFLLLTLWAVSMASLFGSVIAQRCIAWCKERMILLVVGGAVGFLIAGFFWRLIIYNILTVW